jgi:hypothetical protein
MEKYRKALAEYIAILGKNAAGTKRANDRTLYQRHLAEAALMFVAIEKDESLEKLKGLVSLERHTYGTGFLSEAEGSAVESAFDTFAKLVETT